MEEPLEETDLFPEWLFDDDHPDNYFMPINTLSFTKSTVVRRVYALGRVISQAELSTGSIS